MKDRPTLHFNGRTYTLHRRSERPGAPFYVTIPFRGKRHIKSTDCCGLVPARAKAKLLIEAMEGQNLAAVNLLLARPADATTSTIGEALNWLTATASVCRKQLTVHNYGLALRLMLRKVLDVTNPDKLPVSVFNADLVARWFTRAEAMAGDDPGRGIRSAVSIANQSLCVFTDVNISDMRRAGLRIPDMQTTRMELKLRASKLLIHRRQVKWNAPTPAIIDATLAAWRDIREDPNLYMTLWLELSAGLRISEIARLKWEHLTPCGLFSEHMIVDDKEVMQKNGKPGLSVHAIDPFWSEGLARARMIQAERQAGDGPQSEFILAGNTTSRNKDVFRLVGRFLRGVGWKTVKTNHALRALAGGWVVMRYGIYAGQQFLRHSSVQITERHYAHLVRADSHIKPTQTPIEWAKEVAP